MRIILVQSEIEAALRQYVLGQINIAEGQDISIDFKNTRGDDGATAEINISKPSMGNETQKPTQKPIQGVSAMTGTKTPEKTTEASPAPAVVTGSSDTVQQEEQPASSVSSNSEEEVPFTPPAFIRGSTQNEEPKEETPPPSGRSLFANLTKPVNG